MYGMSDRIGMMALASKQSQYLDNGYGLDCAQETAAAMDEEVRKILAECYGRAVQILQDNREDMDKVVEYLLQKETITGAEMMAILEGRDPATADSEFSETPIQNQKPAAPAVPQGDEPPAKKIYIFNSQEDRQGETQPPQEDQSQDDDQL